MSIIAISKGSLVIYWNSIVIALGAAAGLCLSLALCHDKKCSKAAVLTFFPFAYIFSLFISRIMHWYFVTENYASFAAAVTDFTVGGFCISGMFFGCMLAAALVSAMGLASFKNLLDTVSAGVALTIAFIRLSATFGATCHSKIGISSKLFQRLPFAVASTDAAGNTVYKFATFFVAFLLMLGATVFIICFFTSRRDKKLVRGAGDSGNVARLAFVLWGCIEMIMDSTRSDGVMLHFLLLKSINKYVSFISVAMIISAIAILIIFIHYMKWSFRGNGKTVGNFLLIGGFVASVAGIGAFEYLSQRYTSIQIQLHLAQAAFAALMFVVVYLSYAFCVDKDYDSYYEED